MRQALSNQSKDVMRLIDILVFWSIMRAAATSEIVYNNSSKSFT